MLDIDSKTGHRRFLHGVVVNKISCSNIVRMHTKIVFCFVLIFYDPVNIFQSSRHCLPVSAADKIEKNAVAPPVVRLNLATLQFSV